MNTVTRVNRGAANLMELIIVIGVMALLILAVLGGAKMLYEKNDVSSEYTNATEILTNTRSMLKVSGQYDFTGADDMTGALVQFGGVPDTMSIIGTQSSGTAKVKNAWGGAVTVKPATVNGTAKAGFSLTYEKVPYQACESIATQLSAAPGVTTTSINGSSTTGVVSASNAGTQCTDDNNNTLIFTTDS